MPFSQQNLCVRESTRNDFTSIVDYFLKSDPAFLIQMGVDISKLPTRDEWLELLSNEFSKTDENKNFFFVIWLMDNLPVGHSNINKIIFGKEAYMHLHLWEAERRQKGRGYEFLKMSLPFYFDRFRLKQLYCEPNAFNPAPNRTLKKLGFHFNKQYDTTPGWINSFQTVNNWVLDFDTYRLANVIM